MANTGPEQTETFGDAVKVRLAQIGRSQEWLGEQFGVTQPAVHAWLSRRTPPPERVFEIEDVLGIPGQLAPLCGYLRPPDHRSGRTPAVDLIPTANHFAGLLEQLAELVGRIEQRGTEAAVDQAQVDDFRRLRHIVAEMQVVTAARLDADDLSGVTPEQAERLSAQLEKVAGLLDHGLGAD